MRPVEKFTLVEGKGIAEASKRTYDHRQSSSDPDEPTEKDLEDPNDRHLSFILLEELQELEAEALEHPDMKMDAKTQASLVGQPSKKANDTRKRFARKGMFDNGEHRANIVLTSTTLTPRKLNCEMYDQVLVLGLSGAKSRLKRARISCSSMNKVCKGMMKLTANMRLGPMGSAAGTGIVVRGIPVWLESDLIAAGIADTRKLNECWSELQPERARISHPEVAVESTRSEQQQPKKSLSFKTTAVTSTMTLSTTVLRKPKSAAMVLSDDDNDVI